MKKIKSNLTLSFIIYAMLLTGASALQVRIINGSDNDIQLFFRGKDSPTSVRMLMPLNSMKVLEIDDDKMGSSQYFEVIASTGSGGDPDWKLLGGSCKGLDKQGAHTKEGVHTLLIDQCALKVSCKKISEL